MCWRYWVREYIAVINSFSHSEKIYAIGDKIHTVLWRDVYFVAFTYYSVKFRPYRAVLCCILLFHSPNGLCFKI